jgi:hypothetical protein
MVSNSKTCPWCSANLKQYFCNIIRVEKTYLNVILFTHISGQFSINVARSKMGD